MRGNPLTYCDGGQKLVVERFQSLSELAERYSLITGTPNLRATIGLQGFFHDFRAYLQGPSGKTPSRIMGLPIDPTEILVFPTAIDELSLALSQVHGENSPDQTRTLADEFELPEQLLRQPVGSLSGGERVLVALAKIAALAPIHDGVVLCSPCAWLFPAKRRFIDLVVGKYVALEKTAQILLLEGEWPEIDGWTGKDRELKDITGIEWQLNAKNVPVTFPEVEFPKRPFRIALATRHSSEQIDA